MKKIFFPAAIAAIALAATVMPSCKKSDSSPSRGEMLVGTWKTIETGADSNFNGTWDASEHRAATGTSATTIQFNSDGNGTTSATLGGFPISLPFLWKLINGDNDLRAITSYAGLVDTSVVNIISLTSTDGIVRNPNVTPPSYAAIKKQ